MKKLYNAKGKKIHPSPPPPSPFDLLAALPAAILAVAAALSPEEKEVLAYLLSGGAQDRVAGKKNARQHPPELGCVCFCCYKSFWARWDASPNRHLIHQILDAVEESGEPLSRPSGRRRRRFNRHKEESFPAAEEMMSDSAEGDGKDEGFEEAAAAEEEEEEEENDNEAVAAGVHSSGAVRRFVSFIGEKIWGVWNQ